MTHPNRPLARPLDAAGGPPPGRARGSRPARSSGQGPRRHRHQAGCRRLYLDPTREADEPRRLLGRWRRVARSVEPGGREAAWELLLDGLRPVLANQARSVLRLRSHAGCTEPDELVQEALLRLLGSDRLAMRRCTAVNDRQLVAYLRRIVESCHTDLLRSHLALKRGEDVTVSLSPAIVATATRGDDPERRWLRRERFASFRRDLERCTRGSRHGERNRWIFHQTVLRGRDSASVAGELGLCRSSVDSVVTRLRTRLHDRGWEVARRPPG